jgi:hypothetical protein
MALVYAPSGTPAQREPNGQPSSIFHPGAGLTLTLTVASTSINGALPVDANGKAYQAFYISVTSPTWLQFCTLGSDAVTVGGANAILINPGGPLVLAVPPATAGQEGTTAPGFVAAISSTATTLVSLIGIF